VKCKVKAKELKAAIKAVTALHAFGESGETRQPCVLTVTDEALLLESAKLDAYMVKRVPATVLRTGTLGINSLLLADTEKKLSGEVVLDYDKGQLAITHGKTRYRLAPDDKAAADVREQRGDVTKVKTMAKLPLQAFQSGAKFATYKSEIQSDFDVQITIRDGYFEYCGRDQLSYGRFEMENSSVQAKKDIVFVLGNSLLHKVVTEIVDNKILVGMSKDKAIVRFKSNDLDFYHPTMDRKIFATEKVVKKITKSKDSQCNCRFQITQAELKKGIELVLPIGRKAAESVMTFFVKGKGVQLRLEAADNSAVHQLKTEALKTRGDQQIVVRANYLAEFAKAAPTIVPLTVESWNGKYMRIFVEEEQSKIDYMALTLAGYKR
jgi:DNA polymerase III sliding clamp (beta) subunit (PCNA family)